MFTFFKKNADRNPLASVLIVGLGNPGEKYEHTWHNTGFLAADYVKNFFDETATFSFKKKLKADVAELSTEGKKIIILKPQTFMNLSGESVLKATRYFNISKKNVYVLHDDVDLMLGSLRISENISSAGHNGIKSIISHLKGGEFVRLRIGIRQDRTQKVGTEKYVLEQIDNKGKISLNTVIEKIPAALETCWNESVQKAMNRFN